MYCVPCEDKIRHSREEVESGELFFQDPLSLGLPMEGLFTLGLPATLIFFFPPQCSCSYLEGIEAPTPVLEQILRC